MKKAIILIMAIMTMANMKAQNRTIEVADGTHTVIFQLNQTDAANALWNRLPLTADVSNYSNNEKIFYPNPQLDYGSNNEEGDCPAGTLALFSPWGNIVMYYGYAESYPGLYKLGTAISGASLIRRLSGTITVRQTGTTGISSAMPTGKAGAKSYTLSGTMASAGTKGIVIGNGRKLVRK